MSKILLVITTYNQSEYTKLCFDSLKQLIDEIPKIREDVGYVPLVTPSSQIVGAQALMNVLDEKRYETLTKEFVDLVNGEYGIVPGKICSKLLKRIEKSSQVNESANVLQDVNSMLLE